MTPTLHLIPKSVFDDWRNIIKQLESQNRHLRTDLNDAQEQLATAREALQRVERWGAFRGVLPDVNAWTQSGMTGPLPPLPEWAAKWEEADAGEGP